MLYVLHAIDQQKNIFPSYLPQKDKQFRLSKVLWIRKSLENGGVDDILEAIKQLQNMEILQFQENEKLENSVIITNKTNIQKARDYSIQLLRQHLNAAPQQDLESNIADILSSQKDKRFLLYPTWYIDISSNIGFAQEIIDGVECDLVGRDKKSWQIKYFIEITNGNIQNIKYSKKIAKRLEISPSATIWIVGKRITAHNLQKFSQYPKVKISLLEQLLS